MTSSSEPETSVRAVALHFPGRWTSEPHDCPKPPLPQGRCRPGTLLISRSPKEEGGAEAKVEKCKSSAFMPRQDQGAASFQRKEWQPSPGSLPGERIAREAWRATVPEVPGIWA